MKSMKSVRHSPALTCLVAIAALAVAVMGGALAFAGAAGAHAVLVSSEPTSNADLAEPPTRVVATFNEPMQDQFATMAVIGPDGEQWDTGQTAVEGTVISVGLRPGGPAGEYTVNYRATSSDGHVVSGSWSYRLTTAASPTPQKTPQTTPRTTPPTPTPAAAEPPGAAGVEDRTTVWPYIAAVIVFVAAGAVWAVRRQS